MYFLAMETTRRVLALMRWSRARTPSWTWASSSVPPLRGERFPGVTRRAQLFACRAPAFDAPGDVQLLFGREQRHARHFFEIQTDRVIGGDAFQVGIGIKIALRERLFLGKIKIRLAVEDIHPSTAQGDPQSRSGVRYPHPRWDRPPSSLRWSDTPGRLLFQAITLRFQNSFFACPGNSPISSLPAPL